MSRRMKVGCTNSQPSQNNEQLKAEETKESNSDKKSKEFNRLLEKFKSIVHDFITEFIESQIYDDTRPPPSSIPKNYNLKIKIRLMNHILRKFDCDTRRQLQEETLSTLCHLICQQRRIYKMGQPDNIQTCTPSQLLWSCREKNLNHLENLISKLKSQQQQKFYERGAVAAQESNNGDKGQSILRPKSPRVHPDMHYQNVVTQIFKAPLVNTKLVYHIPTNHNCGRKLRSSGPSQSDTDLLNLASDCDYTGLFDFPNPSQRKLVEDRITARLKAKQGNPFHLRPSTTSSYRKMQDIEMFQNFEDALLSYTMMSKCVPLLWCGRGPDDEPLLFPSCFNCNGDCSCNFLPPISNPGKLKQPGSSSQLARDDTSSLGDSNTNSEQKLYHTNSGKRLLAKAKERERAEHPLQLSNSEGRNLSRKSPKRGKSNRRRRRESTDSDDSDSNGQTRAGNRGKFVRISGNEKERQARSKPRRPTKFKSSVTLSDTDSDSPVEQTKLGKNKKIKGKSDKTPEKSNLGGQKSKKKLKVDPKTQSQSEDSEPEGKLTKKKPRSRPSSKFDLNKDKSRKGKEKDSGKSGKRKKPKFGNGGLEFGPDSEFDSDSPSPYPRKNQPGSHHSRVSVGKGRNRNRPTNQPSLKLNKSRLRQPISQLWKKIPNKATNSGRRTPEKERVKNSNPLKNSSEDEESTNRIPGRNTRRYQSPGRHIKFDNGKYGANSRSKFKNQPQTSKYKLGQSNLKRKFLPGQKNVDKNGNLTNSGSESDGLSNPRQNGSKNPSEKNKFNQSENPYDSEPGSNSKMRKSKNPQPFSQNNEKTRISPSTRNMNSPARNTNKNMSARTTKLADKSRNPPYTSESESENELTRNRNKQIPGQSNKFGGKINDPANPDKDSKSKRNPFRQTFKSGDNSFRDKTNETNTPLKRPPDKDKDGRAKYRPPTNTFESEQESRIPQKYPINQTGKSFNKNSDFNFNPKRNERLPYPGFSKSQNFKRIQIGGVDYSKSRSSPNPPKSQIGLLPLRPGQTNFKLDKGHYINQSDEETLKRGNPQKSQGNFKSPDSYNQNDNRLNPARRQVQSISKFENQYQNRSRSPTGRPAGVQNTAKFGGKYLNDRRVDPSRRQEQSPYHTTDLEDESRSTFNRATRPDTRRYPGREQLSRKYENFDTNRRDPVDRQRNPQAYSNSRAKDAYHEPFTKTRDKSTEPNSSDRFLPRLVKSGNSNTNSPSGQTKLYPQSRPEKKFDDQCNPKNSRGNSNSRPKNRNRPVERHNNFAMAKTFRSPESQSRGTKYEYSESTLEGKGRPGSRPQDPHHEQVKQSSGESENDENGGPQIKVLHQNLKTHHPNRSGRKSFRYWGTSPKYTVRGQGQGHRALPCIKGSGSKRKFPDSDHGFSASKFVHNPQSSSSNKRMIDALGRASRREKALVRKVRRKGDMMYSSFQRTSSFFDNEEPDTPINLMNPQEIFFWVPLGRYSWEMRKIKVCASQQLNPREGLGSKQYMGMIPQRIRAECKESSTTWGAEESTTDIDCENPCCGDVDCEIDFCPCPP